MRMQKSFLANDGRWRSVIKEEVENPWLLYLKDVELGGKIVLDPIMSGGTTVIEALPGSFFRGQTSLKSFF